MGKSERREKKAIAREARDYRKQWRANRARSCGGRFVPPVFSTAQYVYVIAHPVVRPISLCMTIDCHNEITKVVLAEEGKEEKEVCFNVRQEG